MKGQGFKGSQGAFQNDLRTGVHGMTKGVSKEGIHVTGMAKGIPKRGTGIDGMTMGFPKEVTRVTGMSNVIPKRGKQREFQRRD